MKYGDVGAIAPNRATDNSGNAVYSKAVKWEEGSFRLGRRPGLDGLRGIAIIMVVLTHTSGYVWGNARFEGGGLGVTIFFVLSGFLITSLLLEEHFSSGKISLGKFYIRRVRRLLPALIFLLIIVLIASLLISKIESSTPPHIVIPGLIASAAYYMNWWIITGHSYYGVGHLWSLAIEEQFYLVWPIILIALLYIGRRTVTLSAVVVLIVASLVASIVTFAHTATFIAAYESTDTRGGELMVGVLLAMLLHFGWGPGRWVNIASLLAGTGFIVALFAVYVAAPYMFDGGLTVAAIASAILVLGAIDSGTILYRLLNTRVMRFLGGISYSLYLWHVPVFITVLLFLPIGSHSPWLRLALDWPLSLAMAMLSHYLIERPFMRMGLTSRSREKTTAPAVLDISVGEFHGEPSRLE